MSTSDLAGPGEPEWTVQPYTGDPDADAADIRELRNQGWTEYVWPGDVVGFVRHGDFYADRIVMRSLADAGACRVLVLPGHDPVWAPYAVWSWAGSAGEVARAVSGLVLPDHTGEPHLVPAVCRMPSARPTMVRTPQVRWHT